ncbi:Uncharacterised protein [Nocardia otitidiscaviarum]|uniref:Uncharacterized protein n=1 Tax=Nocardia otitidiscaviarum TaxID=1823 RepID=A0A379JME3_9NOCA|nr:hypothetical protein [Nocardia otitidiscaviarum]SUD49526.1 Uncharacterised protein [Nocardia otitidiscaviarum]
MITTRAGTAFAAGAASTLLTIAAAAGLCALDPLTRIRTAAARLSMSPAARAELDRMRAEVLARDEASAWEAQRSDQEERSRFDPALLAGCRHERLEDLSMSQLISELDYARVSKRAAIAECHVLGPTPNGDEHARMWWQQVEALRNEFRRRRVQSITAHRLGVRDRIRMAHAAPRVTDLEAEYPRYGRFPPPPCEPDPDRYAAEDSTGEPPHYDEDDAPATFWSDGPPEVYDEPPF